jgi:hypothetical protein
MRTKAALAAEKASPCELGEPSSPNSNRHIGSDAQTATADEFVARLLSIIQAIRARVTLRDMASPLNQRGIIWRLRHA